MSVSQSKKPRTRRKEFSRRRRRGRAGQGGPAGASQRRRVCSDRGIHELAERQRMRTSSRCCIVSTALERAWRFPKHRHCLVQYVHLVVKSDAQLLCILKHIRPSRLAHYNAGRHELDRLYYI